MKNKGFTLTELIAVIVIIGIVLLVTIPVTKNMISKNNDEKYMAYVQLVDAALKTYADMEMSNGESASRSLQELIDNEYITKFDGATVENKTFNIQKDDNGKVSILEIKLKFTTGGTSKNCTKNNCS